MSASEERNRLALAGWSKGGRLGVRFWTVLPLAGAVLLALPGTLRAQFTWTTNSGAVTITGYTGPAGVAAIPGQINGLPVTGIGVDAFADLSGLAGVTIPNGVTTIGDYAFADCTGLTNLSIPAGVVSIGEGAFDDCVSLGAVAIPASVIWIGELAFADCDALAEISVEPSNPVYSSVNGILFNKSGNTILQYPAGQGPGYAIPAGVANIGAGAFYSSGVTNLLIPAGVTSIGYRAFDDCLGLSSVTLPSGVVRIGDYAFANCSGLGDVTIPASVSSIGALAFGNCASLANITVEAGNAAYSSAGGVLFDKGQGTLIECPMGKAGFYAVPAGVGQIAGEAFALCFSLTSVSIPASVTNIGPGAFAACFSLGRINVDPANAVYSSVDGVLFDQSQATLIAYPVGRYGSYAIPGGVTTIGASAFDGCPGLTSVTIPGSVTSIGNSAFYGCSSLAQAVLPQGVANVGTYAFYGCSDLTKLAIPASVASLGEGAFEDCTGLGAVYFQGNAPSADESVFADDTKGIAYYLPGTAGWGTTFGGLPTVLWNAQAEFGGAASGPQGGWFGFTIAGSGGLVVVVEASSSLASPVWVPLATNTLGEGPWAFTDAQSAGFSSRFYRLRSP